MILIRITLGIPLRLIRRNPSSRRISGTSLIRIPQFIRFLSRSRVRRRRRVGTRRNPKSLPSMFQFISPLDESETDVGAEIQGPEGAGAGPPDDRPF